MAEDIEDIRQQKREKLRNRAQEATGETSPSETPSDPIHVEGKGDLQETVNAHDTVLVDFHAEWCGPCQMLEPVIERIAADTQAAVAKVDIDANQALASEHGVRGVPTLLLFSDGSPVERLVGMQDESRLRTLIENTTTTA
ncbi:MAG: thioredoxin [Halobacteriaceae archaeon]